MIIPLLLAQAVISTPTDRSYILATTERTMAELVRCLDVEWEDEGVSDETVTAYGTKVDFRFSNLGGAVQSPSVTMEVHEGEKRTLVMYGFKAWRGAIKAFWNNTAKKCFPELNNPAVVKPAKT